MADLLIQASGVLVAGAILCSLVRLAMGPTLIDRIVALDVLTIVAIVLIAVYAHVSGRTAYLDVALTYGLLSFVSVLAVARYLERGL
ncbi:monovalent cation/H+ antiporter complex subunit F [Sedimentitalea sp. JM2-8]|uniref:Monovalent cation/H+ antiporter complex subunit F n=1 Tax=Sedimentitalea xiamensis TaxID=3050037 RepID=A0ABT7FCQ7_9RHOB|nr:monovalent cation/H+ antiporter complex subunit F [Sedimentitalea xiamensis]MDK3072898.1 monovalent cation/H+ antiporter complex subunit F [Sedimentitalea xiamensis]